MGEITVILLLALIFLGPKKLPELASGLGKIIRDIRKATADVKNEIQLDDAIRKPFEELRDAVTLPPEELKRRDRIKRDLEEAKRRAEADMALLAAAKPAVVAGTGEVNSDAAKPDEAAAVPAPMASSPSGDSRCRRRWPHQAFRCRHPSPRPARAPTATRFRRRFIRRTPPALPRTVRARARSPRHLREPCPRRRARARRFARRWQQRRRCRRPSRPRSGRRPRSFFRKPI